MRTFLGLILFSSLLNMAHAIETPEHYCESREGDKVTIKMSKRGQITPWAIVEINGRRFEASADYRMIISNEKETIVSYCLSERHLEQCWNKDGDDITIEFEKKSYLSYIKRVESDSLDLDIMCDKVSSRKH